MTMTKTKAWVAGTVVIALLLAVAAWFLLISPKRAEAADIQQQTATAAQTNDETRARIAGLKKEFANLKTRQAELAKLQTALPKDEQLAVLTRDLNTIATNSGVSLKSVTPGGPTPVTASAAAPAADASAAASGTLVSIPTTIIVAGNYQNSLQFLKSLQTGIGRNYLVTSLSIATPASVDKSDSVSDPAKAVTQGWVTMSISGSVFAYTETKAAATPTPTQAAAAATTNG